MTIDTPITKLLKFTGRLMVSLCTITVLLTCLVLARLFYAPINLDFARDVVIDEVDDFLPGWQISYETAEIGWDWRSVRPWVSITDIALVDRRERMTAYIPEARVGASFSGLLTGAGISDIEIDKANVHVLDLAGFSDSTSESIFADLLAFKGFPKPVVFKPIAEAFSRFTARLLKNAPRLQSVILNNSKISLVRGANLPDVSLSLPSLRLGNNNEALEVSAQIDAYMAQQPVRIRLGGNAEPFEGKLSLNLSFTDIDFARLALTNEMPEIMSYLHFPVGVSFGLNMTSAEGLRSASFNLDVGEGYLLDPVSYPKPATLQYGVISGAFDMSEEVIVFDRIEFSTGQRNITGNGLIYWEEGEDNAGYLLDLTASKASISDVLSYWPIKTHPDGTPRGARVWVENNMVGGTALDAHLMVNINPDGSTPFLNNSPFQLDFKVQGVETYYLKDMKPLKDVSGSGLLTETNFSVDIDDGTIAGLPIAGSKADMSDIDVPGGGTGVFSINLKGPIQDILRVIDPEPVRVSDRLNLDINRFGGEAEVFAKITLPLVKSPDTDDVKYEVSAKTSNTVLKDLLDGEGLSASDITLQLNNDELTAEGTGVLNGVPMNLYWRENFLLGRQNLSADTSFLVMSAKVDENDLSALKVDVKDYLAGKAIAEASFLGRNLKFRIGYFSADVTDTVLSIPQIAWEKQTSVPAHVTGTLKLDGDKVTLEPVIIRGDNIDIASTMEFPSANNDTFSLNATVRNLNKTTGMTVELQAGNAKPVEVLITADAFDLAPLLLKGKTTQAASDDQSKDTQGFKISLKTGILYLLNGESFSDVVANLEFTNDEPKNLFFTARDDIGLSRIIIEPNDQNNQKITVETQDASVLLQGLGLFPHVDGGGLLLKGETGGWGEALALSGDLEITGTHLVGRKHLSSEVTEGIIDGLDEYLGDDELDLDKVTMPFSYANSLLDINNLKANGSSLGMTMEGQIQTTEGKININGVIVPAYGLNSILGKIPLVGGLFSGGDGKGLFGVTYRIKGLTSDPKVSVNALSGLAPGFLRLLFEGGKGKVDAIESPKVDKPLDEPQSITPEATTNESQEAQDPDLYQEPEP
ncbi:YhdP family protein [Kordiimonas pumila]|uniref:AsmA-like C-terminal domain-containing protein n=1 Tax=Kordiimonas pumila TaxID=2161677 RepID=A0ABV7D2K7_9PROT|nr:AsmA-like C-terminal domain-containing protein [Kordiimonas pumila]